MDSSPYLDGPVTLDELEAGVWARPEHVAIALAVDERTIRRRVRSGSLERGTFAGRVYVRQVSRPVPQAATDTGKSTVSTASAHQLEALLGAIAEHQARVERLALELGDTRARLEHVQAVASAQLDASAERRRAAEQALAHELQRAEQAARELAHERQRRAHLEELTRAPWYAVRVKRRLRRELAG